MSQKVIVSIPKNDDGTPKHALIRQSTTKPEYGSVNVITEVLTMGTGGFLNKRKRSSYFRAEMSLLQELNLTEGTDLNAKLVALGATPIRIKRVETNTPAYEGHTQKMNPETQELIWADDAKTIPVYMQDVVAPEAEADVLMSKVTSVAAPAVVGSGEPGSLA
jgi:hypothetical protein